MRLAASLSSALVLVACGDAVPGASRSNGGATPSPSATGTISSPVASVPSPTLAGDLPVTTVDFSCRLPVVTWNPDLLPAEQGAFITFPAGQLANDPKGTIVVRGNGFATTTPPVLSGGGGGFYDRAVKRWVPASPAATLADGSAYAYVSYDGTFVAHVVNVASGDVRSFGLGSLDRPEVVDFAAGGVFLYSPSAIGGPGEGVWLLNPTTGSVTQVSAAHRVWAVRDGKAWVARLDPRDKTVWQPTEIQPADSLAQVDLATGAETQWFYRAGAYPWMVGLVSGRPLIAVTDVNGRSEIRLIDQPGSEGKLIYSGSLVFDGYFQNYQGDGDRIWLGGEGGIYLYRPDRGIQRVFAYDARSGSGRGIHPGGFCL
jgi:hypothetical protein